MARRWRRFGSPAPDADGPLTHPQDSPPCFWSGAPDAARADIEKLAKLRDGLRAAKDTYWAEQVDIQWQMASAWLLHVEGKHDAALSAMRAAADAEDKTDKATVTPGPRAPARELYGALLLERGMTREALAAYEETMAKEPNCYRGLAGAAKAAELSATKKGRHPGGAPSHARCGSPAGCEES